MHEALEMLDEPFRVEKQPALGDSAGSHTALHRLDETLILVTDQDVELHHVVSHIGRYLGAEEVLGDDDSGPVGTK